MDERINNRKSHKKDAKRTYTQYVKKKMNKKRTRKEEHEKRKGKQINQWKEKDEVL